MKMKIGLLFTAALLSAALAAATPALAADKVSVGLIGSPDSGGWLYYIGVNKGFFAQEGVEPDFIYVPTAPGLMQQLVGGSLDVVGVDGVVEPIHAVAKGASVAILRMISGTTPYEMIAKPSINSVKDLKGKTITIGGLMDINRIYLERIMQANGIKWGEYDVVVIGNSAQRYAALKSGSVDATMLVPPTAFTAEDAGFKRIAMIKDYAADLPMAAADVTTAWGGAHQATAKAMVAALDKSVAWFYDPKNREEAIDILVNISHADRGQVEKTYDFTNEIAMYSKDDTVSRTDLQHLIDAMHSVGDLQGASVTPDQLVIKGLTPLTE
jgi:NitT/TauT family transport system substrate-binding protein